MWECALLKKAKNTITKNPRNKIKDFSRHNSMTKLSCALFIYENKREMGWDNLPKTFKFTQMIWSVENRNVLGWTTSFCGLHPKPHEARGLGKHYHLRFDPNIGHVICAICCIPCSCVWCTSMLDKP